MPSFMTPLFPYCLEKSVSGEADLSPTYRMQQGPNRLNRCLPVTECFSEYNHAFPVPHRPKTLKYAP